MAMTNNAQREAQDRCSDGWLRARMGDEDDMFHAKQTGWGALWSRQGKGPATKAEHAPRVG